ncbi:MAG: HlyD family efflux transporter periplasmic adaptor subunit [Inquilinus sp.]|nr:HlyD family efflux transporter periplasmic adaptor subunit [Inquilinus sp.]
MAGRSSSSSWRRPARDFWSPGGWPISTWSRSSRHGSRGVNLKTLGKWGWRAAGLALVAAGRVYAFLPKPVPVDLAVLERGPMRVTVADDGETRVREVYVVSAPIPGRVLRFEGHVGDPVTAAETVLVNILPVDPAFLDRRTRTELEAAVQTAAAAKTLAEAELARSEAQLEFAHAEYERAQRLHERGNIAEAALDRSRMEVRTEEAALLTARASLTMRNYELETARASLIGPSPENHGATPESGCCFPVVSPVDGRILSVFHESEGVVSAGAALAEIGDPGDLEIVVDLLSTDAVLVAEGAEAIIEGWGGGAELAGRVRRVEPTGFTRTSALGIDEQRVNVIVDFAEPPELWRSLGHGYRVEVAVIVWAADDVLKLPVGALFRAGEDWAVFAAAGGKTSLRRVEIGRMNGRHAEVLQGLEAGETVVLHPSDRVADATPIVARPPG